MKDPKATKSTGGLFSALDALGMSNMVRVLKSRCQKDPPNMDKLILREEKQVTLAKLKAERQMAEAGMASLIPGEGAGERPPLEEEEPDIERLASEGAFAKMDSERAWKAWQERINHQYPPPQAEIIIAAALRRYQSTPRY